MTTIIDIGNTVPMSITAYPGGVFTDKALYTLQIRTPDGEQVNIPGTAFVLNADTQRYVYSLFYTTQAGRHIYRFKIVNGGERAAKWSEFTVRGMLIVD